MEELVEEVGECAAEIIIINKLEEQVIDLTTVAFHNRNELRLVYFT